MPTLGSQMVVNWLRLNDLKSTHDSNFLHQGFYNFKR